MWVRTHLNRLFHKNHNVGPYGVLPPQIFTEWPRLASLAHTPPATGVRPTIFNNKHAKIGFKFSVLVVMTLGLWGVTSQTFSSWRHHRLNGSSSHVLTATSRSYGKARNSTPNRIETPNLIEIKFGTVDYVGAMTPSATFYANPSMGGFSARANGWNIRKFFLHTFYRNSPACRSDPSADFRARWRKRRGLTQGCAFWGLKNSKLIFDPQKSPKVEIWAQNWIRKFSAKKPCIKFSSVNSPWSSS